MRPGLPLLATLALITVSVWGVLAPANAQERIGLAATVRNDVSEIAPRVTKVNSGDDVVRDEVVRTNTDSDVKIVFRDDTNLSIGPGSTLKMDKVVFSGETSYKEIALRLTSGAFRFVTGHSAKQAYVIRTPIAVIGVRGTTLDFLIQRFRNIAVLQHGQATACIAGGRCVDLLNPGDTAIITATGGKIAISRVSTPPWTFASACAANGALCSHTAYAGLVPATNIDLADALCGQ
jgi:hypothetical protein